MRSLTVAWIVLWATAAHAQDVPGGVIKHDGQALYVGDTAITSSGSIDAAAYDAAQDLIWFVSGDQLQVIDLRTSERTPVVIAKRWPRTITPFAITGVSNAEVVNDRDGVRYPVLAWGKSPKLRASGGAARFLTKAEDKAAKKAIKKIKLVGKKWLKAQRKRQPRKVAVAGTPLADRVALPAGLPCDAPQCGQAYTLLPDLDLVVVAGGERPVGCVLRDRTTGKVAHPTPDGRAAWSDGDADDLAAGPCFGYGPSNDGTGYAIDGFTCVADRKHVACAHQDGWTYLGWTAPAAR